MCCDSIEPAKRAKYKPPVIKRTITAYGKDAEVEKAVFVTY